MPPKSSQSSLPKWQSYNEATGSAAWPLTRFTKLWCVEVLCLPCNRRLDDNHIKTGVSVWLVVA